MESGRLPTHALSIRQPWAWLIVAGKKDIENRTWETTFRGPVYIHAAKGMTMREYCQAMNFIALRRLGVAQIPLFEALDRGGIVGVAEIADCVTASTSPWFVGPRGFVIRNVRPLPFFPCKGALGFFRAYHPNPA